MKKYRAIGLTLTILTALLLPTAAKAQRSPWSRSYKLEKQKHYELAVKSIRGFTGKPQTAEFAWLRIGWLEYRAGNNKAAVHAYRKALQINSQSLDARLGLTLPLLADKRYRAAARQASRAFADYPGSYRAAERLAYCQWVLGRWGRLAMVAGRLTKAFPSQMGGWLFLARAKAHQGDLRAARYDYQQVLMRWPDNGEALRALRHPH